MKSLKDFIIENKIEFPITWFDVDFSNDDSEIYTDEAVEDICDLYEQLNACCIAVFKGPKSVKAKRNTNLELVGVYPDLYIREQLLGAKADKGFVITFEDDETLGITYYISGPLPSPMYYVKFVKGDREDVYDDYENGQEPKDFIKIPKGWYTMPNE